MRKMYIPSVTINMNSRIAQESSGVTTSTCNSSVSKMIISCQLGPFGNTAEVSPTVSSEYVHPNLFLDLSSNRHVTTAYFKMHSAAIQEDIDELKATLETIKLSSYKKITANSLRNRVPFSVDQMLLRISNLMNTIVAVAKEMRKDFYASCQNVIVIPPLLYNSTGEVETDDPDYLSVVGQLNTYVKPNEKEILIRQFSEPLLNQLQTLLALVSQFAKHAKAPHTVYSLETSADDGFRNLRTASYDQISSELASKICSIDRRVCELVRVDHIGQMPSRLSISAYGVVEALLCAHMECENLVHLINISNPANYSVSEIYTLNRIIMFIQSCYGCMFGQNYIISYDDQNRAMITPSQPAA